MSDENAPGNDAIVREPDKLAGLAALVTAGLRPMDAYHVPRPSYIRAKLDANESPAPLPPEVAAALGAELAHVALHRYPLADGGELRPILAAELGVPPAQVVLGNGSDELITMLIAAFGEPRPGRAAAGVLYPVPTFVVYRIGALAYRAEPIEVPLRDDFTMDEAAVAHAMATRRPNVAFFALPNNPTGTLWSHDFVVELARKYPDTIIVSDEAYLAYGGKTLVPLLAELPNLVVMRTLSKIGMAALRVGFLAAHPMIVAQLEKVRPPYNLAQLNQHAAAWLLTHHRPWLDEQAAAVRVERTRLLSGLRALPLRAFDSEANLILVKIDGDGRATRVWKALAARGVMVRNFDRPGPLAGCLRITVGTPAEDDLLLEELAAALSA